MTPIKFLADLTISPKTVADLQQQGWDIIRVSERFPPTASDGEILQFARENNRIFIVQDLDFSMPLVVSGYNRPLLIILALSLPDPNRVTQRLIESLPQIEEELQAGQAFTIDDTAVQIRKLPVK